jgi:hypothetical protein
MKELNQLEKQLEQRSIQELEEIIMTFLNSLEKLRNKYGASSYYRINEEYNTTCLAPHEVKKHLLYMLKENHLECMIKYKSKELLSKIDLLS